ncbi:ATP-dependent helicase C-terminal domain-containing protein [Schaalia sp. ZJ1691]|uniref:ATP-dependent RNA helicase n=1 Tax=Schaalia sp. ZJ1691 TaxID=2709404 RepID=UPI0013EA6AC3|nr:ATP-dependent helicase C-terminal domain-containing protein [Schaalia sp. ZJ1691]
MRTLEELLASPPSLPVVEALDRVRSCAIPGDATVISAPAGTGKTTLVPPLLATTLTRGRVIVTQPRRVAVRAAAKRIADLLGEPVGVTVGYSIRGETVTSAHTRIEMVTPGILLRRLHANPELTNVSAVMLDEFHERSLDTDLALAFLLDVRDTLREDLSLIVTSATLDEESIVNLLRSRIDTNVHTVNVSAQTFPLDVSYMAPPRGAEPLGTVGSGRIGVQREFLAHVARVIESVASPGRDTEAKPENPPSGNETILRERGSGRAGDILVFLPGLREIDDVHGMLTAPGGIGTRGVDVVTLHGGLSGPQQDAVLAPRSAKESGRRRVVLATSITETSLTVPGVSTVIDSGLSRQPRFDAARGVSRLVTVMASQASCHQRSGRAARLGPGRAIRLFDQVEWSRRPSHTLPEIAVVDLSDACLQSAVWGAPTLNDLSMLDTAPLGHLRAATDHLLSLGALESEVPPSPPTEPATPADAPALSSTDGESVMLRTPRASGFTVTRLGRALASIALDPSLARALICAAPIIGINAAAAHVCLIEESPRVADADLATYARRLFRSSHPRDRSLRERLRQSERRLRHQWSVAMSRGLIDEDERAHIPLANGDTRADHGRWSRDDALAFTVGLAHPEWIARRRPGSSSYVLANGLGAQLPELSPLEGSEWLAICALDRTGNSSHARIRLAVAIDQADALAVARPLERESTEAVLVNGRLKTKRTHALGAIELTTQETAGASGIDEAQALAVIVDALAADGLSRSLTWTQAATSLRHRMDALHRFVGAPWPDVSDEALLARAAEWLAPYMLHLREGSALSAVATVDVLRSMLPWPQASHLDELAPESIVIPTGQSRTIDWTGDHPSVTLRVQQAFGWTQTPTVLGGRRPLVLHLTDPAGRPVAVTSDLASFWAGPYRDVRAQLRGRYPKHPWPEDPLTAQPTNRARKCPR